MEQPTLDTLDEFFGVEVQALATKLVAKWEAAIFRVALTASQAQTVQFPQGSSEALLARRFATVGVRKTGVGPRPVPALAAATVAVATVSRTGVAQTLRTQAENRAATLLRDPIVSTRLSAFSGLLAGNFSGTVDSVALAPTLSAPVQQDVRQRMMAKQRRYVAALAQTVPQATAVVAPAGPKFSKVQLDLMRIVCVDETNGFLGSEWGSDEIELGGFGLDADANLTNFGPIDLGDFDDNTRKDFSPLKKLVTLRTDTNNKYPKPVFVTLVLAEIDFGGFPSYLNDLVEKVKKEAIAYLSALIGGWVGSAGGPIGTIIGVLVGLVVGKIVDKLIQVWKDDVFKSVTINAVIPSADGSFGGATSLPSAAVALTGPGHYAIRYRWKVS